MKTYHLKKTETGQDTNIYKWEFYLLYVQVIYMLNVEFSIVIITNKYSNNKYSINK